MRQLEHIQIFHAVHNHFSDVTNTKHDHDLPTTRHEHVPRTTNRSRTLTARSAVQPLRFVQTVEDVIVVGERPWAWLGSYRDRVRVGSITVLVIVSRWPKIALRKRRNEATNPRWAAAV
jgi:hypothetical protein